MLDTRDYRVIPGNVAAIQEFAKNYLIPRAVEHTVRERSA